MDVECALDCRLKQSRGPRAPEFFWGGAALEETTARGDLSKGGSV